MSEQQAEGKNGILTIKRISVENLLLDDKNPRFVSASMKDNPSQMDLMRILWNEMAIDELVMSIAANGYFQEEPLFVIPDKEKNGKYIVVEGNRRLAAVKILLNDEIREELRISKMPTIDEEAKKNLQLLPASKYQTRKELWAFLSFRHINSPQEWDPYSKAMYIAKVHDQYKVSLDEIATRIGDQHQTVRRLYRGYKILDQAIKEDIYDIDKRYSKNFFFSHWYTAVSYSQFQNFLGISATDFEKKKPIPKKYYKNLGELLTWIFGKKSDEEKIEPIVKKQNPDLNLLREVIVNPSALDSLRGGGSLSKSHEISIGDERRFGESIVKAKEELLQANGLVELGYNGEAEQYITMGSILKLAKAIISEMDKIREKQG